MMELFLAICGAAFLGLIAFGLGVTAFFHFIDFLLLRRIDLEKQRAAKDPQP